MYLTFSSSQTVDCRPLGEAYRGFGRVRRGERRGKKKERKKERQAEKKEEKELLVTDILYQYCNKNSQE